MSESEPVARHGAEVYYYTGTGNSLWIARTISASIPGSEVISMVSADERHDRPTSDVVGMVFPVHAWGLPARVIRFAKQAPVKDNAYFFAVAVHAGQVSDTLLQLNRILRSRGSRLSSGFEIRMPSNYIPWGGPCPPETQQLLFDQAKVKARRIASVVGNRKVNPIERGPLWERMVFPLMYRLSLRQMPRLDGNFWTDERCNSCGICRRVCPAHNIDIVDGRPVWHHRCEQCLACLQWCPKESVQYGKKTPKYKRYQHPEVKVKDILKG